MENRNLIIRRRENSEFAQTAEKLKLFFIKLCCIKTDPYSRPGGANTVIISPALFTHTKYRTKYRYEVSVQFVMVHFLVWACQIIQFTYQKTDVHLFYNILYECIIISEPLLYTSNVEVLNFFFFALFFPGDLSLTAASALIWIKNGFPPVSVSRPSNDTFYQFKWLSLSRSGFKEIDQKELEQEREMCIEF